MAIVLVLASPVVANAADSKPPRIVKAQMRDADHDRRADAVLVTFSETIRHSNDTVKPFPISVAGYTVKGVRAASGRTVLVRIAEKSTPDATATPKVTYKPTTSKPVTDKAGNQAKAQAFTGTRAHGTAPSPTPTPTPTATTTPTLTPSPTPTPTPDPAAQASC